LCGFTVRICIKLWNWLKKKFQVKTRELATTGEVPDLKCKSRLGYILRLIWTDFYTPHGIYGKKWSLKLIFVLI
jgi:hypothetical protein